METKYDKKQTGSCVDPLWDPFVTDSVTSTIGRTACSSQGEVSAPKSKPLTPQEFQLLSDSNPFKQDIAEKYGLAYPGITTRAHSHNLLYHGKTSLQSEDLSSATRSRRRSEGVVDGVDPSEEDWYRPRKISESGVPSVFQALSQFLWKNKRSIDESIQKIDETDLVITSFDQGGDSSSSSSWRETSLEPIRRLDTNFTQELSSFSQKTSYQQETHLDSSLDEVFKTDSSSQRQLRDFHGVGQVEPESSSTNSPLFTDLTVKQDEGLQERQKAKEVKQDPYLAIRAEDMNRKRDHSKALSESERFSHSGDESLDIPMLSTRSLEVAEITSTYFSGQVELANSGKPPTKDPAFCLLGDESTDETLMANSSLENDTDLNQSAFEDNFSDLSTFLPVADERGHSNKTEQIDHFATFYTSSNESNSEVSGSQISPNLSTESPYKTVRVQKVDSEDLPLRRSSITSPRRDILDVANDDIPSLDGQCSPPVGQEDKPKVKQESKFTSSFYAVFSTTVNSLEDLDKQCGQEVGKSAITSQNTETMHAENSFPDDVFGEKTDNNQLFDAYTSCQHTRSGHDDPEVDASELGSESTDPSSCTSKTNLFQAMSEVSNERQASSRGSISRESMKVNLSQDSASIDPIEDIFTTSSGPPVSETPVMLRNFYKTSPLDPLVECCSSTDSILVHVSNDSLNAVGAIHLPDGSLKPPEKPSRSNLAFDLRRRNMQEQNRRRSLPAVRLKNMSIKPPLSLLASQSVDVETDVSRRRSSCPFSVPTTENIKTYKTCEPQLQFEDKKIDFCSSFKSFGKPSADTRQRKAQVEMYSHQRISSEIDESASSSKFVTTAGVSDGTSAQPVLSHETLFTSKSRTDVGATRGGTVATSSVNTLTASALSFNPFADDSSAAIEADTGKPRSNNADTEIAINEKEDDAESHTQTDPFAEFVRSRIQKPLRAVAMFSNQVSVEPASTKQDSQSGESARYPHGQTPPFQLAQATPIQKVTNDKSEILSFKKPVASPEKLDPEEVLASTGFLENNKEASHNINITLPPDLVPYEEIYSESLQTLPEVDYQNAVEVIEPVITNASISPPESGSTQALVSNNSDVPGTDILDENHTETQGHDVLTNDAREAGSTEKQETLQRESSSSDSDIDDIVQEYRQGDSASDEGDIDHLVRQYKDQNPEEFQSVSDTDDSKNRSSAFNKLGKVLNKMTSVTKYMTKKRVDPKGKEMEEKSKPLIFSPSRKHMRSRSVSYDENAEVTSKRQTEDSDEAFTILSKAAEVFKEQTVRKRRATTANVWKSRSLHTEHVDIDENSDDDYDLVTRAAVLFKGFKTKKLEDTDLSSGKSPDRDKAAAEAWPLIDAQTHRVSGEKPDDPLLVNFTNKSDIQESFVTNFHKEDASKEMLTSHDTSDPKYESDGTLSPEFVVRTPDQTESDNSKLDDSGFESVIKHASELLMRSDATESIGADLTEDMSTTSDQAEIALIEPGETEIPRDEDVITELPLVVQDLVKDLEVDYDNSDAITSGKPAVSDNGKTESAPPVSQETIVTENVPTTHDSKTSGIKETDPGTVPMTVSGDLKENENVEVLKAKHLIKDEPLKCEKPVSEETLKQASEVKDDKPETSLTMESSSPKLLRVLHEKTCDLILSTGYDEGKSGRIVETPVRQENAEDKENEDGQREKTNGKLEELTKEISAVDIAGLKDTTGKSSVDKLTIPEYLRLSSDNSEGLDTHSLTVNLPDSPENGLSLSEENHSPFSLCCGGNIKINLNCTAMMKKPERRPSAVIIKDKRCVMTEEEKLFPLKVSASYREGLDKGNEKFAETPKVLGDRTRMEGPKIKMVQDLKVNEHELNRNFAGSREELLEESQMKISIKEVKPEPSFLPEKDTESTCPETRKADDETVEDNDAKQKRLEKTRSLIEDLEADKKTLNIYDSVMDELKQKQSKADEEMTDSSQGSPSKASARSKRYGRVMSDSDFDPNFGQAIESKSEADQESASVTNELTRDQKSEVATSSNQQETGAGRHAVESSAKKVPCLAPRENVSNILMQQSIDVYDNIMYPESAPPLPERCPRQHVVRYRQVVDPRYGPDTRSSFTSIVSDGAAEMYSHAQRPQGKTKWVSSTPHLPTTERHDEVPTNRTSSYPHLHRPDSEVAGQFPVHISGSAASFRSDSVCWDNYARVEDVQGKRSSYDSESSTSGLVIPGAGRESTLSDVSDSYIFGEYSTVKDDIQGVQDRVIRPLHGQYQQRDYAFHFRHFPAATDDSHYENISVITSQPTGSRHTMMSASTVDVHEDMVPGFEHYAVIGRPMQTKSVQFSGIPTPIDIIKVHCASQTSMESLVGLVRDDASDILEGLPVFEYTLGATQSTHSHLSDSTDSPGVSRFSDTRQPDLTQQTASLDRRKNKRSDTDQATPRKKATKVTFSRDEVLTEVIDGIKKSQAEPPERAGLMDMATSTLSSFGGGVKEIVRIFHVPFQCCRSGKSKEKLKSKAKARSAKHSKQK